MNTAATYLTPSGQPITDPTAQNWQGDLAALTTDQLERRMYGLARTIATRLAFASGDPAVPGPGERRALLDEYRDANEAFHERLTQEVAAMRSRSSR